jgi:hypothetical protein
MGDFEVAVNIFLCSDGDETFGLVNMAFFEESNE